LSTNSHTPVRRVQFNNTIDWLSDHNTTTTTMSSLSFDTLGDVDYEKFDCVEAIGGFVFGAMSAQPYVSVIVEGPVSRFWPNVNENWMPGITTDGNLTTYHLRSSPKGRIGKPLEKGEVRLTSVYVSDTSNAMAKIIVVLSFLVGHIEINNFKPQHQPMRESYSVSGVPLLSPLCFEDQVRPSESSGTYARNNRGHRMILTSTVHVIHDDMMKSFRTGNHDYAVASIVSGVPIADSVRKCYEITTEETYDSVQMKLISHLASQIAVRRPELIAQVMNEHANASATATAAFTLNASRVACDMLSAAGLVDIMASPIACGALPDSMLHPLHIPLILTLLARMAAKPEQYQIGHGTRNDIYAARELSAMMESTFHPILRDPDGEPLWAVDVCATVALTQVKAQIMKTKKKKMRHMDEMGLDQSLNALFSLGVGLCNDVIGCTIYDDVYTDFGLAEKVCGPIELARAKAAFASGLGNLGSAMSTMRVSCRAARQRVLVDAMCEVEEFVRSGICKNIQLMGSSVSQKRKEEDTTKDTMRQQEDENGFVQIPYFKGCDVEAILAQSTSREAFLLAREQLENVLLRGPVVLNTLRLNTYVSSRYSKVSCVECGSEVDVFGGIVLAQMASECIDCCGKRCWQCAMLNGTRCGEVCRGCASKQKRTVSE
jgi:hypothetical protein